jgi:hypothetical protein
MSARCGKGVWTDVERSFPVMRGTRSKSLGNASIFDTFSTRKSTAFSTPIRV